MVGHLCRRKKHTLAIFMGTGIIIIVIRALSRLSDLMLIMIHTPSSFQLFFIYLRFILVFSSRSRALLFHALLRASN